MDSNYASNLVNLNTSLTGSVFKFYKLDTESKAAFLRKAEIPQKKLLIESFIRKVFILQFATPLT